MLWNDQSIQPIGRKERKTWEGKKNVAKMAKAPRRFYVIMNIGKIFTIQIMWILWTAI